MDVAHETTGGATSSVNQHVSRSPIELSSHSLPSRVASPRDSSLHVDVPMEDQQEPPIPRGRWADYCVVEDATARQWVCDLGYEPEGGLDPESLEIDDNGTDNPSTLDPVKVSAARAHCSSRMDSSAL